MTIEVEDVWNCCQKITVNEFICHYHNCITL